MKENATRNAVVAPTPRGLRITPSPALTSASRTKDEPRIGSRRLALRPMACLVRWILRGIAGLIRLRGNMRASDGHGDRNGRAVARRAFDRHRPVVQHDKALDQRQSEAGTLELAGIVVLHLGERPA